MNERAWGEIILWFYAATAVLTVWALVEAVRARTWRWGITIFVLQPLGAFAWFVAGRRFYRHPSRRRKERITEATSAAPRRGE